MTTRFIIYAHSTAQTHCTLHMQHTFTHTRKPPVREHTEVMHNNVNAQQYQIASRHMHSIRFAWRRCRSTSHLQTSLCAMRYAQCQSNMLCQPHTFLGQRTTNELHTVFALFRIKVLIVVMANEFRVDFFSVLSSVASERAHVIQHCHNMCSVLHINIQ